MHPEGRAGHWARAAIVIFWHLQVLALLSRVDLGWPNAVLGLFLAADAVSNPWPQVASVRCAASVLAGDAEALPDPGPVPGNPSSLAESPVLLPVVAATLLVMAVALLAPLSRYMLRWCFKRVPCLEMLLNPPPLSSAEIRAMAADVDGSMEEEIEKDAELAKRIHNRDRMRKKKLNDRAAADLLDAGELGRAADLVRRERSQNARRLPGRSG